MTTIPQMDDRKFWDEYARLKGLAEWHRPIPVSERLPKDGETVLAYDGDWWVAEMSNGRWEEPGSVGLQGVPITYWLRLPPRPK